EVTRTLGRRAGPCGRSDPDGPRQRRIPRVGGHLARSRRRRNGLPRCVEPRAHLGLGTASFRTDAGARSRKARARAISPLAQALTKRTHLLVALVMAVRLNSPLEGRLSRIFTCLNRQGPAFPNTVNEDDPQRIIGAGPRIRSAS